MVDDHAFIASAWIAIISQIHRCSVAFRPNSAINLWRP
jgi:hypothetical protein